MRLGERTSILRRSTDDTDPSERVVRRLEIEDMALEKETDEASKIRLEHLKEELADERENLKALTARWENEKSAITEVQSVKEELEKARSDSEIAERDGDYERVAKLRYGTIPELEKKLHAAEKSVNSTEENAMLSEEVTPETVAEVVSAWTGIPANGLGIMLDELNVKHGSVREVADFGDRPPKARPRPWSRPHPHRARSYSGGRQSRPPRAPSRFCRSPRIP